MSPRIASGIVSIVLAVLLVLAILPAFGPPGRVEPTGGVINGPRDDLASLEKSQDALQARTFLQRWRGVSGPAPGAAIETAIITREGDSTPDPVPEEEQ